MVTCSSTSYFRNFCCSSFHGSLLPYVLQKGCSWVSNLRRGLANNHNIAEQNCSLFLQELEEAEVELDILQKELASEESCKVSLEGRQTWVTGNYVIP